MREKRSDEDYRARNNVPDYSAKLRHERYKSARTSRLDSIGNLVAKQMRSHVSDRARARFTALHDQLVRRPSHEKAFAASRYYCAGIACSPV